MPWGTCLGKEGILDVSELCSMAMGPAGGQSLQDSRDCCGLNRVSEDRVSQLVPFLSSLTALAPQGQFQLHTLSLQLPQSSLNFI